MFKAKGNIQAHLVPCHQREVGGKKHKTVRVDQQVFTNLDKDMLEVKCIYKCELHSTLLDAGHPKPDLVAVHAAVPDLQHLLVPSQGGGKRLKDGRFQTICI